MKAHFEPETPTVGITDLERVQQEMSDRGFGVSDELIENGLEEYRSVAVVAIIRIWQTSSRTIIWKMKMLMNGITRLASAYLDDKAFTIEDVREHEV